VSQSPSLQQADTRCSALRPVQGVLSGLKGRAFAFHVRGQGQTRCDRCVCCGTLHFMCRDLQAVIRITGSCGHKLLLLSAMASKASRLQGTSAVTVIDLAYDCCFEAAGCWMGSCGS
jgi:hypothetical protein